MRRLVGMQIFGAIFLLLAGICPAPALGATIGFLPDSSIITSGDSVDIDVVISGLGAGAPPSVSAFDLTVSFDPAVLTATGIAFGPFLGDPALFEAITGSTISPGSINFAEVSLLSPAALDALQPASFVLATLSLQAVGTTTLRFVPGTVPGIPGLDIKDGLGDLLDPITAEEGMVQVVPEPGLLSLLFLGSGVLLLASRRRAARPKP